jgi:hypothetical protein
MIATAIQELAAFVAITLFISTIVVWSAIACGA